MFKWILAFFLLPIVIFFSLGFFLTTTQLLILSAEDDTRVVGVMRPIYFFYLKNFRTIDRDELEFDMPPLHSILVGCKGKKCFKTMDFLLETGEDINEVDGSRYGFNLLHSAVLNCSAIQVKYLISKGADVNAVAQGGKVKSKTPLDLLNQLKDCPSREEIGEVLKSKGAHD